jgi:TRAP-type C4-dicarboxylate transport system permease small subunit
MSANHQQGAGGPRRRTGFGRLTVALSMAGTVLIVLMAIGVNADILGRNLFSRPLAGVTEFLGLAIVAVVFLQMANTAREERHISNDLIVSAIARSYPRLGHVIYSAFHLLGALLFALIVWFVIPKFIENYQGNYFKGTAGYIEIPVWPFQATVVVGAAAAAIQYLLLAGRELRRAFGAPDV